MQVKSIAPREHSAVLSTLIKLPFVFKTTDILGYFHIINLVQKVVGLTIKQTVCQRRQTVKLVKQMQHASFITCKLSIK